jgi:putative FmdB family regulatory protein
MPLYEYKCKGCDQVFEVMQRFSDEPLKQHEGCGGELEKLLSAPALQFKGSGWYITDYARNSGGSPGKNGGSKTETKADTKTDTPASSSSSSSTTSSTSSDKK